jgi:chromosome segregation ATPase
MIALTTIIPTHEQYGALCMSLSAGPPNPGDVAGDSPSNGRGSQPVADPPTPRGTGDDPLRTLTTAVGSLSVQVAGKDQQIHQLVTQVDERNSAFRALQRQAEAQATEHASREQALRQQLQEITASRDSLLASIDARAAEFETMIALRDQNLTAREWEISSLRSQITGLQQTVKELEARLASIYASRTWVLSKKLWSARTKARKLIR